MRRCSRLDFVSVMRGATASTDAAIFCRNCTNEIRAIGGIDFNDHLGYINDPRIVGAQLRVKF